MVNWTDSREVSRRHFLWETAAAGLTGVAAVPSFAQAAGVPITGDADPALAGFDDLMTGFLERTCAPGAALAVTKAGRLVYARGFGFADEGIPVEPTALFRIASISKPITATAILKLAEAGKFGLDDPAVDLASAERLGIGAESDPRCRAITVRHLLNHTAGWDRDVSGDPIAMPRRVAKTLGKSLPVGPEEVVRYAMGRPLDFDPGQKYAYSNVGYLVLGRIIEMTGRPYEEYVKEEILAPLGVRSPQLGKARLEERLPREVRYYDTENRTGPAVVGPRIGEEVPIQYGGENLNGYEAHGGWVASAIDLVRFASAFDEPGKCPVLGRGAVEAFCDRPAGEPGYEADGTPKAAYYGAGWMVRPIRDGKANMWHSGFIAGTSTLLVRRWDGVNWAVLFNTQATTAGERLSDLIDPLVHPVVDAVREWPEIDLFPRYLKTG
jgi:N-acyl-D-amino-acid deacylase